MQIYINIHFIFLQFNYIRREQNHYTSTVAKAPPSPKEEGISPPYRLKLVYF